MNNTATGLSENIASALCYALGWVTGIVFLVLENKNQTVRFHAMQSVMTFGILNVASIVINVLPGLGTAMSFALGILTMVLWVWCMVQAWQGVRWKVPVIGDEAEKQVNRHGA